MPRISVRMSEETRERLERLSVQRMDSSLNQTIIHLIESGAKVAPETTENGAEVAPDWRQSGAAPRERASSPSAQKENNKYNTITETAGFDASRISFENTNKNSKKAPPDFLPDDWEPPKEFQKSWCFKREYCYETALDIFKSKFKADPQRCSDWAAKWRYFLLNGYLKGAKWSELESEEDSYGMAIGRYQPNFTQTGLPPRNL